MNDPMQSARPRGKGTGAVNRLQADAERHPQRTAPRPPGHLPTAPPATVADEFRHIAHAAGLDLAAAGIRDHGPLGWTPPDQIDEPEPAVAVARRLVLARRRLAALERRRRELRQVRAYWTEAA